MHATRFALAHGSRLTRPGWLRHGLAHVPSWEWKRRPPAQGGKAKGEPAGLPVRRGRSRTSPWQKIVQATLTLLLLFLIFGVVLPQIADWSDVWDALSSLTVGDAVLLIALFILIEVLKGAEQAVAIKPLSVTKAVVASEASSAVSNVVPGPSGTAMRSTSTEPGA